MGSKKYQRIISDKTVQNYFKEEQHNKCPVSVYTDNEVKKKKRYYHKILEIKPLFSNKIGIILIPNL